MEASSSVDPAAGVPAVVGVRIGLHPDYERVTLELDQGGGVPRHRLEYVDRPLRQCGSGAEVHPVGEAWLEVRLEPAAAHTEEGRPTLSGRELPGSGGRLERIYLTCDFEGVVALVLALGAPAPFRVLTLPEPSRLVVDLRR